MSCECGGRCSECRASYTPKAHQSDVDGGREPARTIPSLVSAIRQNVSGAGIDLDTLRLQLERGDDPTETIDRATKHLRAAEAKMSLAINAAGDTPKAETASPREDTLRDALLAVATKTDENGVAYCWCWETDGSHTKGCRNAGRALALPVAEPDALRHYDTGWDEGQDHIWRETVCSVCGKNHDRDESAACPGCEPTMFREWYEATVERLQEQAWAAVDEPGAETTT
jgi:hypothetical protein